MSDTRLNKVNKLELMPTGQAVRQLFFVYIVINSVGSPSVSEAYFWTNKVHFWSCATPRVSKNTRGLPGNPANDAYHIYSDRMVAVVIRDMDYFIYVQHQPPCLLTFASSL